MNGGYTCLDGGMLKTEFFNTDASRLDNLAARPFASAAFAFMGVIVFKMVEVSMGGIEFIMFLLDSDSGCCKALEVFIGSNAKRKRIGVMCLACNNIVIPMICLFVFLH
jgi:hypothetical protein